MFIIFCLVEKLRYARSATRVLSRNNIHLNIIAKPMTERVLVVITLGLFTHKLRNNGTFKTSQKMRRRHAKLV